MDHAHLTVVITIVAGNEPAVEGWLDGFEGRLKAVRPADPARHPLIWLRQTVHFMSICTLPAAEGMAARLLIEVSADGHPDDVLAEMVETMGEQEGPLAELVRKTGSWRDGPLLGFLQKHCPEFAPRLFGPAGMFFTGTPGMTAQRIRDEWSLAVTLRRLLESPKCPRKSALEMLRFARARIFADVNWKWAFVCEPVPMLGEAKSRSNLWLSLAGAVFRDFLVKPIVLAVTFAIGWELGKRPLEWSAAQSGSFLGEVALVFGVVSLIGLAALAALLAFGHYLLRRSEINDVPVDRDPERTRINDIISRENLPGVVQNHLATISIIKPGWFRMQALRLALWVIAELIYVRSQPGFLDRIATIHFARWILLPGTNRLVFLSNFDGTWDSYLEDFIARLREGLTSIWSNTRDFPKTENLVEGGAGDGARFKRWARRQQVPTRFWFSAYGHLTNSRIRINAEIRRGFASAKDETQAAQWLANFGHPAPETIEKGQICPLAFGGLPQFRFAHCLLVKLRYRDTPRKWLNDLSRHLSFGDHAQRDDSAMTIGFTPSGLRALGLDDAALATFPIAFQNGMADPNRARLLGDEAPEKWRWGSGDDPIDAVLILYAHSARERDRLIERENDRLHAFRQTAPLEVLLKTLPLPDPTTGEVILREPFGFRDGLSQPVMRGSPRWADPAKANHVVAPGELVLGYRDNLGYLCPVPSSKGIDIGSNGTFLVVRQFEQHVAKFNQVVGEIARSIDAEPNDERHPGFAGAELEHWVAARMVGRWRDGSSLIRHPHPPSSLTPRRPDNEFLFGRDDPAGLRCPFGAHIRRANPRESLDPGSEIELAISNRHRILRVGREYQPAAQQDPGLLFMCINADIERQFEFQHQTWLLGRNFHGMEDEVDPIVGYRGEDDSMTVPTPRGPQRFAPLAKFVSVLGGAYFFMPSKRAIAVLAGEKVGT